jgi:hypothetical protein
MAWIVGGLLALHGLIHLMGFAQAFGYAQLPQLTQPISRPMGVAWLAASLLVLASAARLAAHAEARWHLPEGEFTYGEFDLVEVAYNVRR